MVGQQRSSERVSTEIDETHAAALAEFEYAKEARAIAQQELAEIKKMSKEIHAILKNIESR
jgi:hypothetical protein